MQRHAIWIAPLLLVASLGCVALQSGDKVDEPALIVFHGDTATITAPERTTRDTPVAVSVRTFGGGCVQEIARTDVTVQGMVAEIRPFNRRTIAEVCTADLRFLDHQVELQFPNPGTATIRVIGGVAGPETEGRSVTTQLERTIIVQ